METVYFTGFSGVGKTMIGRLLASRKNLTFLDTDEYIESKEHKTVNQIFLESGEEYFREQEKIVLNTCVTQGSVVSLGGGAVCDVENRHRIKKTGRVIYLRANVETIYKNLLTDFVKRPLLKYNFTRETIDKMLEERIPYYEELENYIIDVDGRTIDSIFKEALAIYNTMNIVRCHVYIK